MNELRYLPGIDSDLDLAQLLTNPDNRVMKLAARRIGLTRDTRGVKDLIRCMARADRTIEEEDEIVGEGFESLKLIGEAAFDPLVEMLGDPDEQVRLTAIECLGVIGCARSVVPLCEALKNPQEKEKVAALKSLSWLGVVTEDVEKYVVSCLHDNRGVVQLEGIKAAGELCLQSAVPALITRLDPNIPSVKDIIIPALGKIGDPRAVKPLVELMDIVLMRYPFHPIIETAADALSKIGDSKAIRALIITLKKVTEAYYSEYEREAERECSGNCENDTDSRFCSGHNSTYDYAPVFAGSPMNRRSCPGDNASYDYAERYDEFDSIKRHLVISLIRLGEPVIEPLIKILCQVIREPTVRPLRMRARGYCISPEEILVDDCIVILKDLGSSVIEPALMMLHDENAKVRKVGCTILAEHLNDSRVKDALASVIITETEDDTRFSAMASLASFHPCTFDRLIEAISHRHQPFTFNEQTAVHPVAMAAVKDLIFRMGDADETKRSESLTVLTRFVDTAARLCPDEIIPKKKHYGYPRDKGTDISLLCR